MGPRSFPHQRGLAAAVVAAAADIAVAGSSMTGRSVRSLPVDCLLFAVVVAVAAGIGCVGRLQSDVA